MSPAQNPNPVVGCAVTNEWANGLSHRSVELQGGRIVRVHPSQIAVSESHSYSALIYDLAPWDDRALVGINRLRRWRPELPILFYVPPVSRAVALIPRCGGIGNVRFRMQERNGNGMSELRRDIAWLLESMPSGEIITRLKEVFPEMPSSLLRLARYVLRTPSANWRPTVESTARALRLSKRTLERRVRYDSLPAPKELIDWITLLHVSFVASRGSTSISRVARCAGINANDLYRLKSRLADRAGKRLRNQAEDRFPDVLAAFAARCRGFDRMPVRTVGLGYAAAGYSTYRDLRQARPSQRLATPVVVEHVARQFAV